MKKGRLSSLFLQIKFCFNPLNCANRYVIKFSSFTYACAISKLSNHLFIFFCFLFFTFCTSFFTPHLYAFLFSQFTT